MGVLGGVFVLKSGLRILIQAWFWSISHWNSHWSRKKVPTWEGKVVEQKQKQFWKPWGKWQNLGACKIGYLKLCEIRIPLPPELSHTFVAPTFSHHKAFVRVNYEEESEKNVDGDDFQRVQNKHSDLHVAGTVEACSRLTKNRLRGL